MQHNRTSSSSFFSIARKETTSPAGFSYLSAKSGRLWLSYNSTMWWGVLPACHPTFRQENVEKMTKLSASFNTLKCDTLSNPFSDLFNSARRYEIELSWSFDTSTAPWIYWRISVWFWSRKCYSFSLTDWEFLAVLYLGSYGYFLYKLVQALPKCCSSVTCAYIQASCFTFSSFQTSSYLSILIISKFYQI